MADRWVDVGSALDLAAGPIEAEIDGYPIAVMRVGDNLYAYEDRCTHDGENLAGAEIESNVITCPRHGARFCLRTGEALTPPAYEPIRIFPAREDSQRILVLSPE